MKLFYDEFKNFNVPKLNYALIDACKALEFDKAKYIMVSPELTEHGSPLAFESAALREVAKQGSIEMVEYILNLEETKDKSQFFANIALTEACSHNQLGLVNYLLNSSNIPHNAELDCFGGGGAFYFASRNDALDVLQYLIYEMNIEKNDAIKKQIGFLENMDTITKISDWFKNRELVNQLKDELEPSITNQVKKAKI